MSDEKEPGFDELLPAVGEGFKQGAIGTYETYRHPIQSAKMIGGLIKHAYHDPIGSYRALKAGVQEAMSTPEGRMEAAGGMLVPDPARLLKLAAGTKLAMVVGSKGFERLAAATPDGTPPKEIVKGSSFLGPDGKTRIELNDSEAKVKVAKFLDENADGKHEFDLDEIVDFEPFYQAYPHFQNTKVRVLPQDRMATKTAAGQVEQDPYTGNYHFTLSEDYLAKVRNGTFGEDDLANTFLHEMQHVAQSAEARKHGFLGTNTGHTGGKKGDYMMDWGEVEARVSPARKFFDDEERKVLPLKDHLKAEQNRSVIARDFAKRATTVVHPKAGGPIPIEAKRRARFLKDNPDKTVADWENAVFEWAYRQFDDTFRSPLGHLPMMNGFAAADKQGSMTRAMVEKVLASRYKDSGLPGGTEYEIQRKAAKAD